MILSPKMLFLKKTIKYLHKMTYFIEKLPLDFHFKGRRAEIGRTG